MATREKLHRIKPLMGERARAMRNQQTHSEQLLWGALRKSRVDGLKFRRQAVIEPYIVDFLCPTARIVVEIDGDTHEARARAREDRQRDEYLNGQGFRVLRVSNKDVIENLDGVTNMIKRVASLLPTPLPPPSREGGHNSHNAEPRSCPR